MSTAEILATIHASPELLAIVRQWAWDRGEEYCDETQATIALSRDLDNAAYEPFPEIFRPLHGTHAEHMRINWTQIAEEFID